MTPSRYRDAAYAMYSMAHALGESSTEQNTLVGALNKIELEHLPPKQTILRMLGLFYDGLAYGNWPWERREQTEKIP